MSTDIAVPCDPPNNLALFVEQASQVHGIAKALCNTSFVPTSMKGKPDEIAACILYGSELDLPPMTSLRTIDVIQGRPTLSANAMRGLAMKDGIRFRLDETTETRCVMSAARPGGAWTTVTWTIDQAKRLGLTNKDNWKNQPGVMLIARATSQLCRLVAANVLIGATYSSEEVRDLAPVEPPKVTPAPASHPKPVASAPVYAEPELVPEVVDVPLPEFEETQAPMPISPTTRAAVMKRFEEASIKDRNKRNEIISGILGRKVMTVNNITEAEGRTVLDMLDRDSGWPPIAGAEAGA
jgi:hypothetical protein